MRRANLVLQKCESIVHEQKIYKQKNQQGEEFRREIRTTTSYSDTRYWSFRAGDQLRRSEQQLGIAKRLDH